MPDLVATELAQTDLAALSSATGIRLESFRPSHLSTRVARALEREEIADVRELCARLHSDARLRARFRRSVAVSVSGVNRDPQQFDLLERTLVPPLAAGSGRLAVWSAGSADGSELHSLALLLERLGVLDRATLLGSDLLEESVEAATTTYGDARLRFECRDIVAEGPPPGAFALVLCRNVAIYLAPVARDRLYEGVAGALQPGGVLLLGRSERLVHPEQFGLDLAGPNAYRRSQ